MNRRRQFLTALLALAPVVALGRDDRDSRRGRGSDDRRKSRRRRDDDDGDRRRGRGRGGDDYRDARRRREAGEIVPLRQVIERAKARRPGRVVDVELLKRGKRDVYRIEMLDRNGDVGIMRYDARTGEPIGR